MAVNTIMVSINGKHRKGNLKQYFGFTLVEIATKIGLKKQYFSRIMAGVKPLQPQHRERLKQVFVDMDIVTRTKDFKESALQIHMKALKERLKNNLTILIIGCILTSMASNYREYICNNPTINRIVANLFQAVFEFNSRIAFFLFVQNSSFYELRYNA